MRSDIEIAQACKKLRITEIAAKVGIDEAYIEQYGPYKAKVDLRLLKELADRPDGKLVLVTAITPTPAGEGKTPPAWDWRTASEPSGRRRWWRFASPPWGRCSASRAAPRGAGWRR